MATSRPFAYNPTLITIDVLEQYGTLSVGFQDQPYGESPSGLKWWEGPDEDLGYCIGTSLPTGGRLGPDGIYGDVTFWRTQTFSDSQFITLANRITGQNFGSSLEAVTFLNANGYWTSYAGVPATTPTNTPTNTPTPNPTPTPTTTIGATPTTTTTLTPTPTTTTTLTPTPTTISTGDICVSDAGSTVVNGTYTYSGTTTIGGITRPQYIKDVNYNVSIVTEGGNTVWSISNTDLLFTYYLGSTVPPPQYPYQETSWIAYDQGLDPVPTVSSGNCSSPTPSPTTTLTATPSSTPYPTIFTHGSVRAVCDDFCTTNYNITTETNSSNPYAALTIGDFIYGISGAGFIAYSDVSTDTTTGPFRIAEIDSNGEVLSIKVCSGGLCIPL
jgi:hypothetical protein